MRRGKRKINKEIYDRAMEHNGYITEEDKEKVFCISEIYGYGVYGAQAKEENGEYYVYFSMGDSCD